jgi:hypothetical protein
VYAFKAFQYLKVRMELKSPTLETTSAKMMIKDNLKGGCSKK